MKKCLFAVLIALTLMLAACGDSDSQSQEEESTTEKVYSEFTWPSSEIASLIPVPESNIGEIVWEASYGFVIYVAETPYEDYAAYVTSCQESGFTVDYEKTENSLFADNADGYHLTVQYEGDDVMFIRMDEPDEEETEETETVEDDSSEDVTTTTEAQSDETTAAEAESDSNEEATTTTVSGSSSEDDGKKSEFMEAMDSYEAFMDEYVEFMKTYQESDDVTELLTEYAEYMAEYAEFMEKIDAIDQDELTDEELVYYLEVTSRVTQKLLEIAG